MWSDVFTRCRSEDLHQVKTKTEGQKATTVHGLMFTFCNWGRKKSINKASIKGREH